MGDYCVTLTSVLSLLEVKRGLMVVPKPTMLSLVPGGRLFSAITMASCRHKAELTKRPHRMSRMRAPRLTFTLWILVPLMLPLRSTRNSSSLVALWSSAGSLSRLGQKFSIRTGLLRMSLWCRFLTNSSCGRHTGNSGMYRLRERGGLFETPGEGNASEHRPSFRAPNLFERSG